MIWPLLMPRYHILPASRTAVLVLVSSVAVLKSPEEPLPEESAVSFDVVEHAETNDTNKSVNKI